ncbi:MAG: MOSC domain-containing protein [bacterium]
MRDERAAAMRVLSVNVAQSRVVDWRGREITTAFFKEPVAGPVIARALGLDGDAQADPRVHGGPRKAVYAYPSEHYAYWRAALGEIDLPPGSFGENLTVAALDESRLRTGDVLAIGGARFAVTQPRYPCAKLAMRFGDPAMVERFLDAGRSGFYLAVLDEGAVEAGDAIALTAAGALEPGSAHDGARPTIAAQFAAYCARLRDDSRMERA